MSKFLSELKENGAPGSSLENGIFTKLKESIITLSIPPGEKISEMKIAKAMDCSRSPVRDAFRQLQHLGFLEIRPQVGTFVPLIDLNRVEEARFIRDSIETAVMKYGIRNHLFDNYFDYLQDMVTRQQEYYRNEQFVEFNRLDMIFHEFFCNVVDRPYVGKYLGGNSVDYARLRFVAIRYDPYPEITIEQHQDILNALKKHDEVAIEKAVSIHLSNLYRVVDLCKDDVRHFMTDNFDEVLRKRQFEIKNIL